MMVRESQIRRRAFSLTDLRDNRSAMISGSGINPAHHFPIDERREDDGCFCANTTTTTNFTKMNEDILHMGSTLCNSSFIRDDQLFRPPLRKISRFGVQRPKKLFHKRAALLRRTTKFGVKASSSLFTRRRKFGKCHQTAIVPPGKLMDFLTILRRQRDHASPTTSLNYLFIDGKLQVFGDNGLVGLSPFSNFCTFPQMLNHHSNDFNFISRIADDGDAENASLDFVAADLPTTSSSSISSGAVFSTCFQGRSSSKNNHQICQKSLILKSDRVVRDTFDGLLTSATVQVFDRASSSITLTPIPSSTPKCSNGTTTAAGLCDCHPKTNMFNNSCGSEGSDAIVAINGDSGRPPSSSTVQFFNSVMHQFNGLAIDVNSVTGEKSDNLFCLTAVDGPSSSELCLSDHQQENICRQLAGLPLSSGDNSGGMELRGIVPPPTSPSYMSGTNGKSSSTAFFSDGTTMTTTNNNSNQQHNSFGSVFVAPTLQPTSTADASAAFEMSCLKI